jgi:hypothetical protein
MIELLIMSRIVHKSPFRMSFKVMNLGIWKPVASCVSGPCLCFYPKCDRSYDRLCLQ